MKNIHIHAVSPYFEIFEIVPEKKAIQRLDKIKKMFAYCEKGGFKVMDSHLKVKTGVHNPELF